jgi:hypothetical protein
VDGERGQHALFSRVVVVPALVFAIIHLFLAVVRIVLVYPKKLVIL